MELVDTLTMLYQHNLWANLKLLGECAKLSDEQLDATAVGTYGTIRDTLNHIVKAERSYFSRISTGERYVGREDEPPLSIADMTAIARQTGEGMVEVVKRIQAADVVTIDWDGTPRDVPKTIILTQVINHATEHRSQIMAIMTGLSIEPPDLQAWAYFDEMDS